MSVWLGVLSLQMRFHSPHQGSLAECSKALAQGASPQGRGIEAHSCHCSSMLSQQNSDIPFRARRARIHRAVSSRESKEYRKSREQRHRDTQRHTETQEESRSTETRRKSRNQKQGEPPSRKAFPPPFFFVVRAWFCGRLRPATSETPAAK